MPGATHDGLQLGQRGLPPPAGTAQTCSVPARRAARGKAAAPLGAPRLDCAVYDYNEQTVSRGHDLGEPESAKAFFFRHREPCFPTVPYTHLTPPTTA